jgi:hypothetical protein
LSTDLQVLQWWTEAFVTAIIQSTKRIPYGMRYLARETLAALRVRDIAAVSFLRLTLCNRSSSLMSQCQLTQHASVD